MSSMKAQTPGGSEEPVYVSMPGTGTGPGVLVLHAWWGLTPFFKGFCDRLAGEGFAVLAPDLYHGATAATIEQAEKLRGRLKRAVVVQEIGQAVERLQGLSEPNLQRIGAVGFSLGGYWALWLTEQGIGPVAATVVFYGSRGGVYIGSQSAFQFHLADTDPYVSASGLKGLQKSLRAAGREAEFYTYPGTSHWFFESDRPEAYRAEAAELAWGRMVDFLKKHLA